MAWTTLTVPPSQPDGSWAHKYHKLLGQPRRQALLVSAAWRAAVNSGTFALLQNLLWNTWPPVGICNSLDACGVPLPRDWERP